MNDSNAAPELLAILINWLPGLVFGTLWIIYFRRSIALQRAGNEQLRRSADALEQVAARLDKRS
jgi:hypothetical protein